MLRFLFVAVLCTFTLLVQAQDKIVLLNGKTIEVKNVEIGVTKISYQMVDKNSLKKISSYKVFSVQYANGKERIIYQPDSNYSEEFSVGDMRMFIKGEQEADEYYRNHLNKGVAGAIGVGAGMLAIYGLIIPPLYSTIVGNISPDIEKQKVSDPMLRDIPAFREGYERSCRSRKIRNSLLYGFGGFAIGFTAFAIIFND